MIFKNYHCLMAGNEFLLYISNYYSNESRKTRRKQLAENSVEFTWQKTWSNQPKILQRITDDYHFLLVCAELQDLCAEYLSKCYQQNPSLLKLDQLMNFTSTVRLPHLSMYCKLITDRVHCKIDHLNFVHPPGQQK